MEAVSLNDTTHRYMVIDAEGLDDLVPILNQLSLEKIKSFILRTIETDSINQTLPDDVLQSIISYQSNVKETPVVCRTWNELSKKWNAIESRRKYHDKVKELDADETDIFLNNGSVAEIE